MARERTGSFLGAIYVLVGAALLVSALFAPWYFYDGQAVQYGGGETSPVGIRDTAFFLTSVPWNAPVQGTCPLYWPFTPQGGLPYLCPISTSYSSAGFSSVGQVAGPTFALAAAGAAIAAVGGILGLILANAPRRRFPELILALVAVTLAIAATATFAVLLPGAFAHDIPAPQRSFEPSGPWSSFYGSATYNISIYCAPSAWPFTIGSWGPGLGWALSVAATMVLVVGAVMMIRFRDDVAEPVPPAASAEVARD